MSEDESFFRTSRGVEGLDLREIVDENRMHVIISGDDEFFAVGRPSDGLNGPQNAAKTRAQGKKKAFVIHEDLTRSSTFFRRAN